MPSAQNLRAANDAANPNDLAAWWMPFTANRAFKARPRLISGAKGMHYYTPDGRAILDGTAGLWCCNAGHSRDAIVEAIQQQAAELDFAPAFQFGHPKAFELASRIAELAPGDLDHVFFTQLRLRGGRHRAQDRARLLQRSGPGRSARASSAASAAITASASAASRSAASSTTASSSARCLPASTTCRTPTIAASRPSRRASRTGAAHLADELERDRRAARRLDHRRRHRRAGGGLDRRPAAAQGLPAEAARDLRPARHPADLRRGHHRLRPARLRLRRRALRRHAGHDHLRQGRDQRHRADGRRDRPQGHLRRLHEGPGARASSCSTATPIRAIRSPARRRSPRSTSTATRACSSAPGRSKARGPTRS